ncbi:hypothetical protein [Montanilutibacter psychrotolerans]|uniref:hypothetical protein n=1 Tax=Montanilutibacter psychrotolerans TaxID=1327343 RepID=UPI0011CDB0AF|nr:hypothetical protein [Lysobacter psychrotolerans]
MIYKLQLADRKAQDFTFAYSLDDLLQKLESVSPIIAEEISLKRSCLGNLGAGNYLGNGWKLNVIEY